jgi:hypothetical protein
MHLFALPTELRLKIYSKLFFCPEPIHVSADYYDWKSKTITTTPKYSTHCEDPQGRPLRIGFGPALLRVNKQLHTEASQVLYAENRFEFVAWSTYLMNESSDYACDDDGDLFASFLPMIGSQARYLRHIRLPWPAFKFHSLGKVENEVKARKMYAETLELVGHKCTSLTTLRLDICLIHQFFDPYLVEELDFLAPRLAVIASLKNVIIQIQDCSGKGEFREGSIEMLTDRGWIVEVIGVEAEGATYPGQ